MKKLLTLILSASLMAQPVFAAYTAYPLGDGSVEVTGIKDPDKETTFLIKNASGTDLIDIGQVGTGEDEFSKILYIGDPDGLTYNVEVGDEILPVKNVSVDTAFAELEAASYAEFGALLDSYNKMFGADTSAMENVSDKEAAYKALADFDFSSPENVAEEYADVLANMVNIEKQKALELVKNGNAKEAVEKFIVHFEVDSEGFEDVANKALVYAYLNGNEYNEEEFAAAFNDGVIIALISEATEEEFAELVKANQDKIGMDLSTDVDDSVFEKLSEKMFTSYDDIKKSFKEEIALFKLNTADKENVKAVLEAENDVLKILDVDGYSSLSASNKKSVCEAMAKIDFNTIQEAKEEFERLVKRAKTETPSAPGGSSSSSSSGGGGYAVSGGTTQAPEKPFVLPFGDVAKGYWGYEAISELYKKEIISGVTEKTFEPERHITREEFIKMLVGTFGLYNENANNVFTDVANDHWSVSYLASAYEKGLTLGKGDGSFGIGETLTRQDMAVLSARCAEISGFNLAAKNPAEFDDEAEFSEYALESIYKLSDAGIINGMGNGLFAPKTSCTRAMAAKVCYELLKLYEGGAQ